MNTAPVLHYQRGAATLLTAMALMMATTTLVLSVVHSQLLNSRMDGNAQQAAREYLLAEAGLDYATTFLRTDFQRIAWSSSPGNRETAQPQMPASWLNALDIKSRKLLLTLSRPEQHSGYIEVTAQVIDTTNNRISLTLSQFTRPIGILSPAGEQAPPLVLNGCILAVTGAPDLYPEILTNNLPSAAIWSSQQPSCHPPSSIDLHQGTVRYQYVKPGELWNFLFSVDQTEYARLVNDEITQHISVAKRHYWRATQSDLQAGYWTRSIGSPRQPVVLVFPDSTGCPGIHHTTSIYGIVFYQADCTNTTHLIEGSITGTLAINGSLGRYTERLDLAHISRQSNQQRLEFPILKVPRLAGTWRDF